MKVIEDECSASSRAYCRFSSEMSIIVTSAPSKARGTALRPLDPRALRIRFPSTSVKRSAYRSLILLSAFPRSFVAYSCGVPLYRFHHS